MSVSKKFRNNFIKVTIVLNRPGNPLLDYYMYAPAIVAVGPCAEEYTKMGASSIVERANEVLYVTEHYEDVLKMLESIEVD